MAKQAAEIREEFAQELANRDYAFNNAKETIENLEKEVEDLQDGIQKQNDKEHLERVRLASQPKPAEQAAENYRMDRDDSVGPSGAKAYAGTTNEATSSKESKVFYPAIPTKNESEAKAHASPGVKNSQGNPIDWGDGS